MRLARRIAVGAGLALVYGAVMFAPGAYAAPAPEAAGNPAATSSPAIAALPGGLLEALAATGLIGRGDPVAAFAWTLENKRPARAARRLHERFAGTPQGAPAGLSPMQREVLGPEPRPPRAGVSVRGLTVVRPNDTEVDVRVRDLALPLREGSRFRLDYDEDGSSLSQECTVGGLVPASVVFASIPGEARDIACSGEGRYRGIPVQVSAKVAYFLRLGVFLVQEQRIDTPLGALRAGTRVLSFEMASP
jgi:hypothetical protein